MFDSSIYLSGKYSYWILIILNLNLIIFVNNSNKHVRIGGGFKKDKMDSHIASNHRTFFRKSHTRKTVRQFYYIEKNSQFFYNWIYVIWDSTFYENHPLFYISTCNMFIYWSPEPGSQGNITTGIQWNRSHVKKIMLNWPKLSKIR